MDYSYLKLIHLLAVMLFMGNIITGLFWMHIAFKTNDLKIISHSITGVIKSDRLFTIPGVIIITAAGLLSAIYGQLPILRTGWIFYSILLFTASGIAFMWKVVPLQKRLQQASIAMSTASQPDFESLKKTYRVWEYWGLFALITPLFAFAMMVLKIPN